MSEDSKGGAKVHASVITAPAFANPYRPIRKADEATQLNAANESGAEWIMCPVDRRGLANMVDESTILPQCIKAYAANIAGFGIGVRYIDDKSDPNEEAERELLDAQSVIERLSVEYDTKQLFEHLIEARETYGCAYAEVIRDPVTGVVRQLDFIEDTETVEMSVQDCEPTDITIIRRGVQIPYSRRFRHYRQRIAGKCVNFREFGDPRIMDWRTGEYVADGEAIPPEYQANEIIEFAIGAQPYGEIRWRGTILGTDGAYRAEILNHNYFINGRHTPLLIFIKGGMLDAESEAKLQHYMASIKGESGQHAFIVLCAESSAGAVADGTGEEKPDIELKDLSPMLQKDALFQEYIDSKRRQVQSAFLLPDLYVGYTTEFNRATAQTAKQVTEEQVFKGEREALAWILNNKILADYGFQYVEAYFLAPDLSNPDDLYKLLTVCGNNGGLTPNKAKEIVYEQLGEQAEPYTEPWGDMPLALAQSQGAQDSGGLPDLESLGLQLNAQIAKAESASEREDVIAIMKSVRDMLGEMQDETPYP